MTKIKIVKEQARVYFTYIRINNLELNSSKLDCFCVWKGLPVCLSALPFNERAKKAYLLNVSYQIWVRFIFIYQKPLKRTFKTGFWVQNCLLICVLVLCSVYIHKGYCEKASVKCSYLSFLTNILSCMLKRILFLHISKISFTFLVVLCIEGKERERERDPLPWQA